MTPPVVLVIGGSDSGSGAGIQADLKAVAANRGFATTAITAVTAQNTAEVRLVHPLPIEVVRAQIDAVLDDFAVAAVKTGMLVTAAVIELVAGLAEAGRLPHLVVDPVMVSSTGTRLLDPSAERLYRERLLPVAAVFTPNLREAGVLVGEELRTLADQQAAATELARHTAGVVVVKGGHATADSAGRAVDVVARDGDAVRLSQPRIDTGNTHGTGCSFASATATRLAHGDPPMAAITAANTFVHRAIEGAAHWHLGAGHGPLDHFHWEQP